MHCPTCNGNIIGDSCLQCGRSVVKLAPYKKRSCEHVYGGKKYKSTSRAPFGTCSNCQRSDMYLILDKCGTCWRCTKGFKKGTPEYEYRLKVTRERLNKKKFNNGG